ncbi:adenylate/guanylate cyclase domain-containing protein [Magnetofaba australis]|uniref:adenylate/guanylate cyclase domain-containing protein n=1 Tax=Magnetofaba australis TaxID=1472297 RepID=UPI001301B678|nr:adenylate/guanylate cyclase domain-containing protein [Magnetofaba australis]
MGISITFGAVMVLLMLGLVGFLFQNNAAIVVNTATESMQRATAQIERDAQALIQPVSRVVDATAHLALVDPAGMQSINGLQRLYRQLNALPQIFSLYLGEENGDFYQILSLPRTPIKLGPTGQRTPNGARYVTRLLETQEGIRADRFHFFDESGKELRFDEGAPRYDPRVRPWYDVAWNTDGVALSKAYVFSSSKLVGLTLSRRIPTIEGDRFGVVGADITLSTLSTFLSKAQIGRSGRVFLIDENGALVGHRDPSLAVDASGERMRLRNAAEVNDPLVSGAVKAWRSHGKSRFEADLTGSGDTFLVSFSRLSQGDLNWTVGVVVKRDELVGPLADASLKILLAGAAAVAVAILCFMALSMLLTKPLGAVVNETERIRRFDLSGELMGASHIREVSQLVDAVETMKRSLRSFSVYVPKEIVRAIVEEDNETNISSRRQPLTLMFSDIRGFTNISEKLDPEELVGSLSEYMETMSAQIHRHHGAIDKFIGDAIMALWNAPKADYDHVANACMATLSCRAAGHALAELFESQGRAPFYTRFGVHTGEAVVGNVGSKDRMQYSAFGDVVNMAARLESMNKQYGTELLVSQQVAEKVNGRFLLRRVDCVIPVGSTTPMSIYELLGELDQGSPLAASSYENARCGLWHEAMNLYDARQWENAEAVFQRYVTEYPDDIAGKKLLNRCRQFVTLPPSLDWDGAFKLESK